MPHAHTYTHVAGGSPDAAGQRGREVWYSRDALGVGKHPGPASASTVPPGMRFAHAVAAEPCGSPIDFGSTAQDILSKVMFARVQAHATDK